MALIERFTPGGNLYPDGSSTFAMLVEFFRRQAENRDIRDQAVKTEATNTAVEAAVDALAPNALQEMKSVESIFSVVDEDDAPTWIDVAPDGGLTAQAVRRVAPAVAGPVAAEVGLADMNTALTGMSVAIVDEDNKRTWLEADEAGAPTERAAELIRIALDAGPAQVDRVICSGDSMTGGAWGTTYPTHLANLTGWNVTNDGVGGENTTTIAGRMGGRPMLVAPVTIPATGAVTVALQSDDGVDSRGVTPLLQQDGGTNPVRIAGVEGTLAVVNKDDPATRYYTFTRSTAGTAVGINYPTPLITRAMRDHRTGVHVMWWGTNDTSQTSNDATHIIARQRALIEHLTETKPRYLVLGLTVNTAAWRAPMNRQFLQTFGRRFVDLGAYLSSPAAMQDAGLTPTAADTTAQAEGKVPPSLLGDPTHLNNTGNQLVARRVADRIQEMGWLT